MQNCDNKALVKKQKDKQQPFYKFFFFLFALATFNFFNSHRYNIYLEHTFFNI